MLYIICEPSDDGDDDDVIEAVTAATCLSRGTSHFYQQ